MTDTRTERFRVRLREVIEGSGLSVAGFARRVGVDRSTLSQILSPKVDRLPRAETLMAIAESAQVSLDWLVGLSQEGGLGPDIIRRSVEIEEAEETPFDEKLVAWRQECLGYKIRYVPTSLPDLLKVDEVIAYEYAGAVLATKEQELEEIRQNLAYQRRPETDMEVCSPVHEIEAFARGEGIWRGLSAKARNKQLLRIAELVDELYPRFRWFMYEQLERYSAPLTIFGPKRAVLYLGQSYLVLNSTEHIRLLTEHFDSLIRGAVVEPKQVPRLAARLAEDL